MLLTASPATINDASTLFSPYGNTEHDKVQIIDQAIITTTEGLSRPDGVRL